MASLLLSTLDTLYYAIITMTVRFVEWVIRESTERPKTDIEKAVETLLASVAPPPEVTAPNPPVTTVQVSKTVVSVPITEVHIPTVEVSTPEETIIETIDVVSQDESEQVTPVPPPTFKTVEDILSAPARTLEGEKNIIMYAGTVNVPIFKNPTIEIDTQLARIPYGEIIMVLEQRGRFARVAWNAYEGWVLRDDLADRAVAVYPEFAVGEANDVDHPNTARVRTLISDTFGLGRSEFPLQAGEYVVYRLWRRGVHIPWEGAQGRVPGAWHQILKGKPGVKIGVRPQKGAIMEYMHDTEIGHVAYVDAVFPDAVIAISEVNMPDSGVYNERELTEDMWKELRPVFITIE